MVDKEGNLDIEIPNRMSSANKVYFALVKSFINNSTCPNYNNAEVSLLSVQPTMCGWKILAPNAKGIEETLKMRKNELKEYDMKINAKKTEIRVIDREERKIQLAVGNKIKEHKVLKLDGCVSLRDVKIIVPPAVEQGHRAILQCHYNLEGDTLYAVKWYKGEREFFRYTPRESPSIKQFAIPGHRVLEKESNGSYVVLEDVILENTGQYCCEVSADAPSFFTEQRAGFMQVVQSPRHDPVITGLKHRYRLGELLKAECKSNKSRPAANLTWFVNGRNVEPIHVRHHRPHYTEGYYISHSGLRIKISEELFSKGRLKIRCVANLFDVYHRSSEISVELERPKPRVAAPPTLPPSMNWESLHRTELQTTLIFAPPEEQESNQGCVYPLHTKLGLLSLFLPLIAMR